MSSSPRTGFFGFRHSLLCTLAVAILLATSAAHAGLGPTFTKAFNPNTIGPGSSSRLVFTITNPDPGSPVTDLDFTDILPAGVTLATPATPATTCTGGTLTAPDGGSTVSYTGGSVGAGQSCTVSVNVTSSTVGTHMNVSGLLSTSAGSAGPATADLNVVANRPGFSKSFSPATISRGARSTLTFSIDNTANAGAVSNLSFTDVLPTGIVVADPANASTSCASSLVTATPGSSSIALSGLSSLAAGATCTVSVDVIGTGFGKLDNTSGEFTSILMFPPAVSSGFATASLDITASTLALSKSFTDDPTIPGDMVTLEFTLQNRDRGADATNVTFTDDLDATLSGLVALGLPANNVCGAGSVLSGTSLLTLTGGSLGAGETCTFSVTLQVPASAVAGAYPNVTSMVTGDLGGTPTVGDPASETLFVSNFPRLTKTFLTNPAGAGDTVSVELTITNTSATSPVTDIAFSDNIDAFLSGTLITSLPPAGFCGAGSFASSAVIVGETILFISGANLPASGSCTFSVDLQLPAGTPAGSYPNTTSVPTATVDGQAVTGKAATDTLVVGGAPRLMKEFTDDPVLPGATVTLQFTLTYDEFALADATAITFTDDLDATLSGLVATGLPVNDVCGAGSQISGTSNLTLTGGTLAPGGSCTFNVTLQVPMAALPGTYPNITSNIVATVSGTSTTGSAAGDSLVVAGLTLSKEFTDDPVIPGATANLRFTIVNSSPVSDATSIFFTDNLNAALTGLVAVAPLPATPCGAGSSLSGTSNLIFIGGDLTAGSSCTFDVTVQVPGGAADGSYLNATSNLTATIEGSMVVLDPATDLLVVSSDVLFLQKVFTDDPVAPGGTVTLEFTLTNMDATQAATAVTFTDDLGAALAGLTAVGLPINDVCGMGSQISGTSLLTLTGGNLPAGGSCTFSVTLQVPGGVPLGAVITNTTSSVSGLVGGLAVTGAPASDNLLVQFLRIEKSFDGPTAAGGTPVLTFTLTNLSGSATVEPLDFSDDLNAVLTGLVATGLPMSDVCGAGSQISGTGFLTFNGGTLLPGGSCSIPVTLQVPAAAGPGTYPNTTSDLFVDGVIAAEPATADLVIEPPPTFAKAFVPDTLGVGPSSTLTFTIDNSASAIAASALDFTDNLPAGVVVAAPANSSTTCTGGTLTAAPGTGVVSYTGGSVGAGATCTVQADVVALTPGTFVNTTGDLTSSSGNSGTASDTLVAEPPPTFVKAFAPDTVAVGQPSTLTFTIDNSASAIAATVLDFTDNLPAGVIVSTPANASTTCTGGTLTATPGAGSISYTGGSVAAGASCTVQADVVATAVGSFVNTSSDLTSSSGNSGTASDTLVAEPPPTFAKVFAPNPIGAGGISTLTFTIDNSANTLVASTLDFTDNLPAGVVVATPANASTTCTGGTLTATPGTGSISYTGGSVAAGATCTVQADVTAAAAGTYANLSGDLTSSLGNSGTAADDLFVLGDIVSLSKTFTSAPVLRGGFVDLQFTVSNLSPAFALDSIAFSDDLDAVIPGLVAVTLPATGFCGAGSTITGTSVLNVSGGGVAAGGSCTFSVTVQVPADAPLGIFTNTTGVPTGVASGVAVTGAPASADLETAFLDITKTFAAAQAMAGESTVLTFTIVNPDPANTATGIQFTDDLDAVLSGLVAAGLPVADVCGTGSLLSGTSVISLAGGVLGPGESCTFDVTVVVPLTAPAGVVTNLTSVLGATVGGLAVLGDPSGAAQADVEILPAGLAIPTLDSLGLILLAACLALFGLALLRRRALGTARR